MTYKYHSGMDDEKLKQIEEEFNIDPTIEKVGLELVSKMKKEELSRSKKTRRKLASDNVAKSDMLDIAIMKLHLSDKTLTNKAIADLVGCSAHTVGRKISALMACADEEIIAYREQIKRSEIPALWTDLSRCRDILEGIRGKLEVLEEVDIQKATKVEFSRYVSLLKSLALITNTINKSSESLRRLVGADQPTRIELEIKQSVRSRVDEMRDGIIDVLIKHLDEETLNRIHAEMDQVVDVSFERIDADASDIRAEAEGNQVD